MYSYDTLIDLITARKDEKLCGITFILSESEEQFVSYGDLYHTSLGLLYNLQAEGFKQGDKVIFQIDDNKNFMLYFWACILGGIIPVPVTTGTNDEQKMKLFKIWEILKEPGMIASGEFIARLEGYAVKNGLDLQMDSIKKRTICIEDMKPTGFSGSVCRVKPEDMAFIQFSSGSTGDPKGVIITHKNVLVDLSSAMRWIRVEPNDRSLNWMPLTHDMGLIATHIKSVMGCINQYNIHTQLFIRHPTLWIEKASQHKATLLYSPNFGYKHFLKFMQSHKQRDWDLSSVRLILNGAEPISVELCNEFMDKMAPYGLRKSAMYPVYGLAEGTIAVALPKLEDELCMVTLNRDFLKTGEMVRETVKEDSKSITFVCEGYPIYDCYMRICDEENNDLGEDRIGYIQIKGGNVTSGYYNNEEATRKTITEDGWLNTGDLGFMRGGRIFVTGRAKDIIFAAGQNYYSHDIEKIAEAVDGIELGKVVAVGVFDEKRKSDQLVMFVMFKSRVESFLPMVTNLREVINQRTGIEVSEVIPVKSIPKTTSGKVQRYKLRESYINGEYDAIKREIHALLDEKFNSREIELPRTALEERLVNIWMEVLNAAKVGINDSFFALGGDSLKATQLISRIRDEFKVELGQTELFENPEISKLAVVIDRAVKESAQSKETIARNVSGDGAGLLSFGQQRLWFLDKLNSDSSQYNLYTALRLRGSLDLNGLVKSFNEVVNRHEILRASFIEQDGQPIQVINNNLNIDVPLVDLMGVPENEREHKVLELAKQEAGKPFVLSNAPLLRGKLFRLDEQEHILLLAAHHIVFDGWSLGIFFKELAACCDAIAEGRETSLPEMKIQYSDFVSWQLKQLQEDSFKTQLDYWKKQLGGRLPVLDLPLDKQRPAVQTYNGAKFTTIIPSELAGNLQEEAGKKDSTLFMMLLAAFNVLLYRYTGQEDIIVGSPVANRSRLELEGIIGFFTNNLVLRTGLSGELGFTELLHRVRKATLEAYSNQDVPFEKLVEELHVERDMSRNPIFQVLFSLQNTPGFNAGLSGVGVSNVDIGSSFARFDLAVDIRDIGDGLAVDFEYNTDLFQADTISRLAGHYCRLLESIVRSPEMEIDKFEILTKNENQTILRDWNNTVKDLGGISRWTELFEAMAQKSPNAQAVVMGSRHITYRELNHRANQLANYLISIGIGAEDVVGIYIERSIGMVVGLLGVHKAGGAYLPMDPIFPQDRLAYMIENAQVPIILTDKQLAGTLPPHSARVICLDEAWDAIAEQSGSNPQNRGGANNLAYLIYTSGSTGKPKGVQIEHYALTNFLISMAENTRLTEEDALLAVTTLSFDIAGLELFMPLTAGARIVLASREEVADGSRLIAMLEEYGVTMMQATPATWRLLTESGWTGRKGLRILCGGEALPRDLANQLLDRCHCLLNVYGPTETTIWSTMTRIEARTGPIPIGKPIANTQVYVLDKAMNPVPVGIPGELFIGGDGLARGYLHLPELTREKFIPDPFSSKPGARMYKTGDLVRFMADGNMEFVGRIDHQVKIRGFRIELGEIETVLNENPAVKESVVVAREIFSGEKALVAYIIPQSKDESQELAPDRLRKLLKEKLPDYMVPAAFVVLESFPMTPNGKIDRKALPTPENLRPQLESNYIAPSNDIENGITAIWQETLGLGSIGINDNFFDLGGHSLLLSKVRSKILKVFNKDISMLDLFKYPTINTLARYIEQGGTKAASDRQTQKAAAGCGYTGDIAVIGLSMRVPGARNVKEFWRNLCDGVESISRFSDEDIAAEGIEPDLLKNPNYVKAWGALEDIDKFDAAFFGYNPREAEILDPQQRIFLEECWKALENAGYDSEKFARPVGVFASTGMNSYVQNLYGSRDSQGLASDYQIMISNDKDFLATRVAYKLNLEGPGLTVQTACSSSLVAVHLACRSLLEGECHMALAGGVSIRIPQKTGYVYQEGMILSPDGHCRAFDEKARGTVGGNGAGVVVLKRLEDAINDGDCINAVIKGTAINNDGALKVGYTAPRIDGQAKAIAQAQANAGVDPATITYIEAHGTGTPLGDPIELEALKQVFGSKTDKKLYCAIGSVKTNVGHLDAAAGVTGLIKTVLALKNKVIPPSLNYEKPNPKIDFENSPFYVNAKLNPWENSEAPLRAGVSSFGIGGTNAHAVLEEAPAVKPSSEGGSRHLLVFSAKTGKALDRMTANFADFLKENPRVDMADAAYTLQIGRKEFECRRFLVCTSREDAIEALESSDAGNGRVFTGGEKDAAKEKPIDENNLKAHSLEELGHSWLTGTKIDWGRLYEGEKRKRIPLPEYPFEGQSYWVGRKKEKEKVEAKKEAVKESDISEWFYAPVWKQSLHDISFDDGLSGDNGSCCLVLAYDDAFTDKFTAALQNAGLDVVVGKAGSSYNKTAPGIYSFNPDNQEDYDNLLKELAGMGKVPGRVINLLGVGANNAAVLEEERTAFGKCLFYSMLYLAQGVGRQAWNHPMQFKVLTKDLHKIFNESPLAPEKALALGPVKVIPREYPNIKCGSVDFVLPQDGSGTEDELIEQLAAEVCTSTDDSIVAYRGMERWIQGFEKIKLKDKSGAAISLKKGGVYLITGGTGGMGLVLAQYLAREAQAKLVLVGRSMIPDMDGWNDWLRNHDEYDSTSRKIRGLMDLRELGVEVLTCKADVASFEDMENVRRQAQLKFGKIDGVIHAAGNPGGGMIQLKKREFAENVLAPKVQGTAALYETFKGCKPDFFIFCSSLNAITGGFGQVDYSAANGFLDAFAQANDRRSGTRVISIDWDRWPGVGMAGGIGRKQGLQGKEKHPLLGRQVLNSSEKAVYLSEMSPQKDWVLSEHLVMGTPTIAGTTYLEMARAAFTEAEGPGPVEISGVTFLAPMAVRENEKQDVFTTLSKNGTGYTFSVVSRLHTESSDKVGWQEHVRGTVSNAGSAEAKEFKLTDLAEKCSERDIDISRQQEKQAQEFISFGKRWRTLNKFSLGGNEGLVEIELGSEFAGDLEQYRLHPALLDVATGALRLAAGGNYLPFSYEKLVIKGPLSQKIYAYIRFKSDFDTLNDIITCDIDIVNDKGIQLVEIRNFSMKLISEANATSIKTRAQSGHQKTSFNHLDKLYEEAGKKESGFLNEGISEAEGQEVFRRILKSCSRSQIIVSTKDIRAAIEQANYINQPGAAMGIGEAEEAMELHPRPELDNEYVAPKSDAEKKLARLWQRLLGVDRVGIHDEFFALGGDSLLLVQFHSKLKEMFETDIAVVDLYKYNTVASLAKYLSSNNSEDEQPAFQEVNERANKQLELMKQKRQQMLQRRGAK